MSTTYADTAYAYMRYAFTDEQWQHLCDAADEHFGGDAVDVLMSKAVRHADDGSTFHCVTMDGLDGEEGEQSHRNDPKWLEVVTTSVIEIGPSYLDPTPEISSERFAQ